MKLKEKLQNGEVSIGSWITIGIGNPSIAEIMAKSGFDWLTVDMEHSAITLDLAQQLIQIIELCGVAPLVRVGENDPNLIKRVMDAGAHGIIVPMVNTKEDAMKAVNAVRYPPEGTRGVGLARAQGYSLDFERYRQWANSESIIVVQIEHIEAVENLKSILEVRGIDAFMVGPYDLSGSLGVPGDFDHPKVRKAFKKIQEISEGLNVNAGFHVVPPFYDLVLKKISEGYSFIAFGVDFLFLGETCRSGLKNIKKFLGEMEIRNEGI